MLTTPNEAIKILSEWYKGDMNQPISLLVDDMSHFFELMFGDEAKFAKIFKEPKDVPKELIANSFDGLTNDDRVWEAIKDSYEWDINKYLSEVVETTDDEPLWDN
jgi:hypothetical protein